MKDQIATAEEGPDGQLILNDPVAVSIFQALTVPDRQNVYKKVIGRVEHFVQRMKDTGRSPELTVIVILQVDDEVGGMLADALMPGANWHEYRDRGEDPFARGMATREPIRKILEAIYPDAAQALASAEGKTCVVVVANGGATIFDAQTHEMLA